MSQNLLSVGHSSRNADLMAAARKKIEEGIAEHHRSVIEMKIRLNTFVLIACLPSEILSEIFLHYIHGMLPADSSSSFKFTFHPRPSLRYLKITHVCHHWREVALNSPRLWSYIDVGPLRITQELLARSKAAPLIVKAHHSHVSSDSLLQVFEASPRIQELRLNLLPQHYMQLASIFPKEATQLQKITLTNPSSIMNFPSIFDECALPCLRDLHIDGYSVLLPHPIFVSTLTRLVVRVPRGRDVPMDKVLDVIQNSQDLQHLELSQLGSLMVDPNGELPRSGRQVTLPKLASLHLTHEVSVCAYTLRQLVIPSSATVELHLNHATGGIDIAPLVPVVFDKLSGNGVLGPRLPVLSAGLWQDRKGIVLTKLCCWKEYRLDDLPETPNQPDFLVSFAGISLSNEEILKRFGSMIPGEEITSFCIEGDGQYSGPVGWSKMLETMPNLEALHAISLDSNDLITILSPLESDGDDDAGFALQHINCLKISNMTFPYDDDGDYMNSFIELLLVRKDTCSDLEELEIKVCCNFLQDDFEALAAVVEHVEWDRLEMVEDNEEEEEEEEEELSDYGIYDDFDYDDFEDFDDYPPDIYHMHGGFW